MHASSRAWAVCGAVWCWCAGDTQGIDRVMQRVKAMYEPVEAVSFNVFDYANNGAWKAAKAAFYTDNEDIKVSRRLALRVRPAVQPMCPTVAAATWP